MASISGSDIQADVTEVVVRNGYLTVKTELMGDYEFNSATPERAQKWKKEIEQRMEQSKLTRSGVHEQDKYKESYAHFKDLRGINHFLPFLTMTGHSKSEAVTSDEEGAVSGEEGRRPSKWTRRISGSFQRITGSSKDAEAKKEVSAEATVPAETAAAETPVVVEPAPAVESSEPAPAPGIISLNFVFDALEMSPKEKRKSFSGFATGLWKTKGEKKEASPEPAAKETTQEATTTETAAETTTPAPAVEAPPTTEETPAPATTETKTEKPNKRGSIFGGLLSKKEAKDKAPMTNGDASESTPAPTTSEPAVTESAPAAASEEAEFKPPTPKKDTLTRRLTSGFKSLGRSKSPEKGKAAKVSDEAPKIDTPIESTPPTEEKPAPAEPETKTEAPLSTTEVPSGAVDSSASQVEPTPVPVVPTQA